MAISSRYCRSVRAIVKTARTSDLSLRGGRRPTWQSREGPPRSVPVAVKTVLAPIFVIARRPEADVAISGRHPRSVPAAVKTVLAPRFVIARSEATWQSREGTAVRNEPSKNGMHPRFVIARSEATWQSREGTPDPHRPPLKQCWPPRLVIARRPEADVAISQYSLG